MSKSIIIVLLFLSFPILGQDKYYEWEIALPGKVISTPVERKNGDIILICEDRRLYSISSKTGNINWKIKPGGKLDQLYLSLDGSIIIRDNSRVYSMFSDGSVRWSENFIGGFNSNMSVNDRGDIFFFAANELIKLDRFGTRSTVIKNLNSNHISALNNSLIISVSDNILKAVTYSGETAWSKKLPNNPVIIRSNKSFLYVVYDNGVVEKYLSDGVLLSSLETGNENPVSGNINFNEEFLIIGDRGTTLIQENNIFTYNNSDPVLYYSNGLLIKSNPDWTITAEKTYNNFEYYPSGKKQVIKRTISLSDKQVWNDDKLKGYYKNIILGGDRDFQLEILKSIEDKLSSQTLLDDYPNFYGILLLSSSKQNINQDVRLVAYRIMGLSRDISFLPYLLSDLEDEKSYIILPYIFYALGQLGVDRNGGVIELINSRIDDYFDEKLVINALYALYYINNYTNSEFVDKVFNGIEKILNGGYSRNIEKRCYDILNKLK